MLHTKKLLWFTVSFILSFHTLYGKALKLSGEVRTTDEMLQYATVVLRFASDSSIVKAEVTNEDGAFRFIDLSPGNYFIGITYIGYQNFQSQVIVLQDQDIQLPTISLIQSTNELDEVVVVEKKPLIEVMADKTIFNVENTLNSTGTNGFELLRKAPGVIIDNNDQIILEGKTGVQIFINGRLSPLAGEDLTNFLSSLQSSEIEAVEIMTQPSSKYDAAGNAGVINIRLKKDKRYGTNGSASAGFAHGKNSRYNGSLSLNSRSKKSNLFGSMNHNFGDSWSFIYLDRIQQNVRYDSKTETLSDNNSSNMRIGLDLFPGQNHTIGVLLNGNFYQRDAIGTTNTPITPLFTGETEQVLIAHNNSKSDNYNLSGNLNYQFKDTMGHTFGMDLDYGRYRRDRMNDQPNAYIDGQSRQLIFERNFRMVTPTDVDIFTVKADYAQNALKGTLSFGMKYSYVQTDNTFQFYNIVEGNESFDENRSNQFVYFENITAAYLNFYKKWNKWTFQGGLRAENTVSEGDLISTQSSIQDNVKRSYLDFFPSGGITYSPNWKSTWAFTYSSRIQRPNYQSLNPFENQLDELSFAKGNPFLQPQYTDNIKFSHTYKYRLTTSISYSYIRDFFAQITDTLGAERNFLQTRNIANQRIWNVGISYPFDVNKWWSVYASLNAYHSSYDGQDDKFNSIDQATMSFYGQNTFSLPKDFKLEISGWFSSPSVWGGTYLTKSLGSLDIALQKKFFQDKLSVRVAVSDLFFTSPWVADMEFGDLRIAGTGGWESRQVKVNFNYAFGSNEVKIARKRKTGLEDEKQRIESD